MGINMRQWIEVLGSISSFLILCGLFLFSFHAYSAVIDLSCLEEDAYCEEAEEDDETKKVLSGDMVRSTTLLIDHESDSAEFIQDGESGLLDLSQEHAFHLGQIFFLWNIFLLSLCILLRLFSRFRSI